MVDVMPQTHLSEVDLDLLRPLRALLDERHVTRAAKPVFERRSQRSLARDDRRAPKRQAGFSQLIIHGMPN